MSTQAPAAKSGWYVTVGAICACVLGATFAAGWVAGQKSDDKKSTPPQATAPPLALNPGDEFQLAGESADGTHQFAALRVLRVVLRDGGTVGDEQTGGPGEWRIHFHDRTIFAAPVKR